MNASLLPGMSSRTSAIRQTVQTTNSGNRYADSTDAAEIPNANVGDYIIDGPNPGSVGGTYPKGFIDIRPSFGNTFTLGAGKKVVMKNVDVDYVYIENPGMNGVADNTRIFITCFGNETTNFKSDSFTIVGGEYWELTGKYDPGNKLGNPLFKGHDDGYAYSGDKYLYQFRRSWLNIDQFIVGVGGNASSKAANHFAISYCNVGDGGFGISLKWDYPPIGDNVTTYYKFYSNFVSNSGAEGGYFGQNTTSGSHRVIAEVYNNRFVYLGHEGLQMGNWAEGSDCHNNVFIGCALYWKNPPIGRYQDRGIQFATRNGVVKFRKNIVVGCSDYFINAVNDSGAGGVPADNPQSGYDIEIDDNLFIYSRHQSGYLFSNNDGITGYKIRRNHFYFVGDASLPSNLKYSSVYTSGVITTPYVWDIDNVTTPILLEDNKYHQGMTFLRDTPSGNITQSGNVAVANPPKPQFINGGHGNDFNWLDLSYWSATIGESSLFPSSGTNKGQPNVYNYGNNCLHKSKRYTSNQDNNAGHEPQGVTDFWWTLVLYSNGTTEAPHDYRLEATDPYNEQGIGLLDNPTPTLGAISGELITSTSSVIEGSVKDNTEIQIAAFEAGTNQVRLKIDYPTNILSANTRIVGIGSSTMAGSGASSPNKLHEQLKAWVTANITGGDFFYHAVPGLYSDYFVNDADAALSDWNRNIEATLALDPDIVIVSLPSNDPAFNTNAQFLANLIKIDDACKAANVYCFVTTTQPRNGYTIAQQQQLYDMAQLIRDYFKTRCIDVFTELANPYTVNAPATTKAMYDAGDTIHVNNAGHTYITNTIVATLQAYFANKGYIKYQVERSTSQLSGFSLIQDNVTSNEVLVSRASGVNYYYRVRAQRANLTYTDYSNTVQIQQSLYAGDVLQLTQINLSRSPNTEVIPGWHELIPSGDVPDLGEIFTGIKDVNGNNTGYSLEITGGFTSTTGSGGRAGEYPLNVIRSNWRLDSTTKAKLKLAGLDQNYLYNIKVLTSTSAAADYRFTGVTIGDRRLAKPANDPVNSSNDGDTIDFLSVKPNGSGEIELKIRALATTQIGYVNAIQIEKLNLDNSIPGELITSTSNVIEGTIIGGSAITGRVNINFTGTVDSNLTTWNDLLNIVSGTVYNNLLTDDFNNSGLGVKITNKETNAVDNGSSYAGSTDFPALITRYAIYRSGSPGMIIEISNCNADKLYDLSFLATRLNNSNVVSFTINGVTQNVTVNNNLTPVVFSNIVPDGNLKITCTVAYVSGPSSGYTYVAGMIVDIKNSNSTITGELISSTSRVIEGEVLQAEIIGELISSTSRVIEGVVIEDNSPAVLSTTNTYLGTEKIAEYQPSGYSNNSNLYPLIVWACGAGETGFMSSIMTHDLMEQINKGDTLEDKFLVCAPEGIDNLSSWDNLVSGKSRIKWAIEYMQARYRVDPNRIIHVGYSLGGASGPLAASRYQGLFAACVYVSGSQVLNFDWSSVDDVVWWCHHGTSDPTQAPQNSIRFMRNASNNTGMNLLSPKPKKPPLVNLYWGLNHGNVSEPQVFRRKSSGVDPSLTPRSDFDWHYWALKQSRDPLQEATLHTDDAERTGVFMDYVQTLKLVNALASSSEKTALLARLSALYATIGTAYVVSLGSSTYVSPAPINNITNINNGISISNLTDYASGASSIGFTIVNRFSTWLPQTEFSAAMDADYWGLGIPFNRSGARVLTSISNGQAKFTGLDNSAKYKLIVLHSMINDDDLGQQAAARVLCNGVTINQYSQYNTTRFMEFDEISPTNFEIPFYPTAPQTRDWCITGVILIKKP